jgi:hypothetical protein
VRRDANAMSVSWLFSIAYLPKIAELSCTDKTPPLMDVAQLDV